MPAKKTAVGFNDQKWTGSIQCLGTYVDHHARRNIGTLYGCGAVFDIDRDDLYELGGTTGRPCAHFRCPDCGITTMHPQGEHFTGLPNAHDWFARHPQVPTQPVAIKALGDR